MPPEVVPPSASPSSQLSLFPEAPRKTRPTSIADELRAFDEFGTSTLVSETEYNPEQPRKVTTFTNEFWTAKQRDAHSLHEISYRACFKPQLPRFFVERLTKPGDTVYDPFMGRGTTPIEAALLGRVPAACDINPLSAMLGRPRLRAPQIAAVAKRLEQIDFHDVGETPEDLLVFYHPEMLRQLSALKKYLLDRQSKQTFDEIDDWIRMVALNRLTGHSPGFFSVYTLPPNQATSVKAQLKINKDRNQTPPVRDVPAIILKKSRSLLSDLTPETQKQLSNLNHHFVTAAAWETPQIESATVSLVVTSPPFLDVVNYAGDNWLRCWFAGIDPSTVVLTVPKDLEVWREAMTKVFIELHRVLKAGGHVAFEVGEVKRGKVKLEKDVLECGVRAGLTPELVLINAQEFTKTANCWGVANNTLGTNTNRIVLFRKS